MDEDVRSIAFRFRKNNLQVESMDKSYACNYAHTVKFMLASNLDDRV